MAQQTNLSGDSSPLVTDHVLKYLVEHLIQTLCPQTQEKLKIAQA